MTVCRVVLVMQPQNNDSLLSGVGALTAGQQGGWTPHSA